MKYIILGLVLFVRPDSTLDCTVWMIFSCKCVCMIMFLYSVIQISFHITTEFIVCMWSGLLIVDCKRASSRICKKKNHIIARLKIISFYMHYQRYIISLNVKYFISTNWIVVQYICALVEQKDINRISNFTIYCWMIYIIFTFHSVMFL